MSTPSSVILRILAGLGGAATGAGGALQDITQNRQRQSQIDIQRQAQAATEADNRAQREIQRKNADNEEMHRIAMQSQQDEQTLIAQRQLDQAIAAAQNAKERATLEDTRKRLEDYQTNWQRMGITAINPQQAANAWGEKGPSPEELARFGAAIDTASKQIGNRERMYIPGFEQYGGFVYQGHPFNPNTGSNNPDALTFRRQQAFSTMLNNMQTQIRNAYSKAYSSFSANPAVSNLIKGYGSPSEVEAARRQADLEARNEVQDAAQAALNSLYQAFPDEAAAGGGLTVEHLLGKAATNRATPRGLSAPTGAGSNITLPPQGAGAPQGGVDPSNPLGLPPKLLRRTGQPAAPAAQPVRPGTKPKFNDFLNFGSRP